MAAPLRFVSFFLLWRRIDYVTVRYQTSLSFVRLRLRYQRAGNTITFTFAMFLLNQIPGLTPQAKVIKLI